MRPLLLAFVLLLAVPSIASARDHRPSDAPRLRAQAAGETKLTFDSTKKQAKLRLDDGYDLDRYMYRDDGTLDFTIDLKGFDPDNSHRPELVLEAFDVDQNGGGECGPEVDDVKLNGTSIGKLTGANNATIPRKFDISPTALNSGANTVQIDIDTTGSDCWAVQINSAEITFPFNIAHTSAKATDDVTVRRGTTDDVIGDEIWARKFTASGDLAAPAPDDPAADTVKGTLTYGYELSVWDDGASVDWQPRVKATVATEAACSGCGAVTVDGWAGTFKVPMPEQTGKHRLTVTLEIYRGTEHLVTETKEHVVYVVLDQPKAYGHGSEQPKTAWLDRAFDWGAAGKSDATRIAEALNAGIYANPLSWVYGYKTGFFGLHTDGPVALVEGTGTHGECGDFRDVWGILAASVGIPAGRGAYVPTGGFFITSDRKALDGNASANARNAATSAFDRWRFGNHKWGTFDGRRYDPTFGMVGADSASAFERESVLCTTGASGGCLTIGGTTVSTKFLFSGNAAQWRLWEYTLPPAPPPLRSAALASVAASDARLNGSPAESGVDADGNAQFERLRLDVPVRVTQGGELTVFATISSASGTRLGEAVLEAEAQLSAPGNTVTLDAGDHSVRLAFDGRALREADGPYTIDLRLHDDAGGTLDATTLTTRAYDRRAFEGALATVQSVTDALVGSDVLRVTVQLAATGTGTARLDANLSTGGTPLAQLRRDVPVTAGTHAVTLDFPVRPIVAAGADGPYAVDLAVSDARHVSTHRHTTAAHRIDQMRAPAAALSGAIADRGHDADADGRFDALEVEGTLTPTAPGDYLVTGRLRGPAGGLIARVERSVTAAAQPVPVQLRFDGRDIGVDGPYTAELTVADAQGDLMTRRHVTAAYAADAFERPALGTAYTDALVDDDGDGLAEQLRVGTTVTAAEAGPYELRGVLVGPGGRSLLAAESMIEVEAGEQAPADLYFDGGALRDSGIDGPYRLAAVELRRAGEVVDTAAVAHRTAAYAHTAFQGAGVPILAGFTDRGEDADGDGKFDELVVDVGLVVPAEEHYTVHARLVDAQGEELLWGTGEATLEPGNGTLPLRFDGRFLHGRGVDGPYHVKDLSVIGSEGIASVSNAHTTRAYAATDFDAGGVVTGTVTAKGAPVADALVALNGVDFTRTDASGHYRLTVPETGSYRLSIDADDALAPWRITRDGTTLAVGTAADLELAGDETATVDFASAADATAPATAAALTPEPNAAGWHAGDVEVRLTASDESGGSGVESVGYRVEHGGTVVDEQTVDGAEATVPVSLAGVTTIAYSATDAAGNVAPEATVVVRIDRTGPGIALTAPVDGAAYEQGQTVTAAYACADDGAGVADCAGDVPPGQRLDTGSPGDRTFTVTARDRAGNVATRVVRYRVLPRVVPALDLGADRRQGVGSVLRKGIATRCAATVAGRCAVTATIGARAARRLGLRLPRKVRRVVIGRASARVTPGVPVRLAVELDRRVRRGLIRTRRLRVRLTAELAGTPLTATRRILVVRGGSGRH